MDDDDMAAFILVMVVYFLMSAATSVLRLDREPSRNRDIERCQALARLYLESDNQCHSILRMNRISFHRLCERLEEKGLTPSRWVGVKEQVAMFLCVLGHDNRMRYVAFTVIRSTETFHRHFHNVLRATLRLGRDYIKQAKASHSPNDSGNPPNWAMRYFQNCVGAIDGTFIPAIVPYNDQPRYRNRKGDIAHNVLAASTFDMKFTYVLAGWEGSAHDTRLLRAAVTHQSDKLIVPKDKYYLGDAGFPLVPGFLVPYRGTTYHLKEIDGKTPKSPKEIHNFRHSQLRNVIERSFGLLKKRFAYLQKPHCYSVDTQVDLILACCILHNFIRCIDPDDEGAGFKELPNNNENNNNNGHGLRGVGGRLPLARGHGFNGNVGFRERCPVMSISERSRAMPPPPRTYSRKLVASYPRSSSKRDFARRDELPPRSRVAGP